MPKKKAAVPKQPKKKQTYQELQISVLKLDKSRILQEKRKIMAEREKIELEKTLLQLKIKKIRKELEIENEQ